MKNGHAQMTREQLIKVGHLLNMRYRPAEIAEEIGCHPDTIFRSYIPAGCPHERDSRGRVWVIGTAFRDWAKETFTRKASGLPADHAYCLKCRKAVKIVSPEERPTIRQFVVITGTCPECGSKVNRGKPRATHGKS